MKQLQKYFILTVLTLLFAICSVTVQAGEISGTVIQVSNGDPVANIQVTVSTFGTWDYVKHAVTGSDGNYTISDLEDGIYKVTIFTDNTNYVRVFYSNGGSVFDEDDASPVEISGNNSLADIDFTLTEGKASISGFILDDNDNPMADHRVGMWNDTSGVYKETRTTSQGWFELSGLLGGEVDIKLDSVADRKISIPEIDFILGDEEHKSVGTLVYKKGYKVSGTITLPTGKTGNDVWFEAGNRCEIAGGNPDNTGYFEFIAPDGDYTLNIEMEEDSDDYKYAPKAFTVNGGDVALGTLTSFGPGEYATISGNFTFTGTVAANEELVLIAFDGSKKFTPENLSAVWGIAEKAISGASGGFTLEMPVISSSTVDIGMFLFRTDAEEDNFTIIKWVDDVSPVSTNIEITGSITDSHTVSGAVTIGASPYKNPVVLLRASDNRIISRKLPDTSGNFLFTTIADDSYKITVEDCSLPEVIYSEIISISGGNATQDLELLAAPVTTPPQGVYNDAQTITISTDPVAAETCYTTDGTIPERKTSTTTVPDAFSVGWLTGKTLYCVWYGSGEDANSNELEDVAVVARYDFTATTVTYTGIRNHNSYPAMNYAVIDDKLLVGDDPQTETGGHKIVCGSTDDYIKTHYLEDDNFDNTDIFFFDETKAVAYADALNGSIRPCTTASYNAETITVSPEPYNPVVVRAVSYDAEGKQSAMTVATYAKEATLADALFGNITCPAFSSSVNHISDQITINIYSEAGLNTNIGNTSIPVSIPENATLQYSNLSHSGSIGQTVWIDAFWDTNSNGQKDPHEYAYTEEIVLSNDSVDFELQNPNMSILKTDLIFDSEYNNPGAFIWLGVWNKPPSATDFNYHDPVGGFSSPIIINAIVPNPGVSATIHLPVSKNSLGNYVYVGAQTDRDYNGSYPVSCDDRTGGAATAPFIENATIAVNFNKIICGSLEGTVTNADPEFSGNAVEAYLMSGDQLIYPTGSGLTQIQPDTYTYRFDGLPVGTYVIKFTNDSSYYFDNEIIVTVSDDSHITLTEETATKGVDISGTATINGTPVNFEFTMEVVSGDSCGDNFVKSVWVPSNTNGDFEIKGLPLDADLFVRISDNGQGQYTPSYYAGEGVDSTTECADAAAINRASASEETISFNLVKEGGVVSGKLVNEAAQPVAGVRVSVYFDALQFHRQVYSDSEGNFELSGLPEGDVEFQIYPEFESELVYQDADFPLLKNEVKDMGTITLESGIKVSGFLNYSNGNPAIDVELEIEGTSESPWVQTGNDGSFKAILKPGKYAIGIEDCDTSAEVLSPVFFEVENTEVDLGTFTMTAKIGPNTVYGSITGADGLDFEIELFDYPLSPENIYAFIPVDVDESRHMADPANYELNGASASGTFTLMMMTQGETGDIESGSVVGYQTFTTLPQNIDVNVDLSGHTITGRVTRGGQGFGRFVTLWTSDATQIAGGSDLNANGNFALNYIKPGSYKILFAGPEYPGGVWSDVFTVTDSDFTVPEFDLDATGTHSISATAGTGGTISPAGTLTVDDGSSETFTITPSEGYVVDSVKVNGIGVTLTGSTYTIENITGNKTIAATFKKIEYELTVIQTANGSISPSGNVKADHGTGKTFTVTPDAGYSIVSFTADGMPVTTVTPGEYTVSSIQKNMTITATFTEIIHTIEASSGENGTIDPSGSASAAEGSSKTFTFMPDTGYIVDSVTVGGEDVQTINNTYTFSNITENAIINVTFKKVLFTITPSAGENGSIFPPFVIDNAEYGSNTLFTITPDEGYFVSSVKVNTVDVVLTGSNYTIENITENKSITATFARITHTINATAGLGGKITPSGNTPVAEGTDIEFTIAPDPGYIVDGLEVDGVDATLTNNTYTFSNVTESHSIAVNFSCPEALATVSDIPATTTTDNMTVTISGEISGYRYSLDGGAMIIVADSEDIIELTSLDDGEHRLEVYGVSQCGTVQADPVIADWTQDTIAPVASILNPPAPLTQKTSFAIEIGGEDVVSYRYRLDSGEYSKNLIVSTAINISPVDGRHILEVLGSDETGNEQNIPTATIWNIDTTPPTAEIKNCPQGTIGMTSINVTITGDEVAYYRHKLNEGEYGNIISVNQPVIEDFVNGEQTLYVIAADAAGNWQEASAATESAWTVDTSVPTALLSDLPEMITNQDSVTITVDDADITAFKYMIDGSTWFEKTAGATIEVTALDDGAHTLYVNALGINGVWQGEGNGELTGSATAFSWTVDTTAPATPTSLNTYAGMPSSSTINLEWEVSELLKKYELRYSTTNPEDNPDGNWWNDATEIYCNIIPTADEVENFIVDALLPDTGYYVALKSVDLAGNTSVCKLPFITTENTRPLIDGISLTDSDLTISGKNFSGNNDTIRFVSSGITFDIGCDSGTQSTLLVAIPKGAPEGIYNLRVIGQNGVSALSVDTMAIEKAPVSQPEVTNVSPATGTNTGTTTITITGKNFAETMLKVEVASEELVFTRINATTIEADVDSGIAEGLYHVKVFNTDLILNEISAVQFEVYSPKDLTTASGAATISKGAKMPDAGSADEGIVPIQLTLTTDNSDGTPAVSDAEMKISAEIEPGTKITLEDGSAYTGTIEPPRQIIPPKELSLKDDAVVFTMGNSEEKLNLGDNQFIFVTIDVVLPETAEEPKILYYSPSDESLSLAGVDKDSEGNSLTKNGVVIVKGGTILNRRSDSPEVGFKTLTYGLYLDHMSTYVAGFEKVTEEPPVTDEPEETTPSGSSGGGSCFIGTANNLQLNSMNLSSVILLAVFSGMVFFRRVKK